MTTERAIEILDPEHREHYESMEPANEATVGTSKVWSNPSNSVVVPCGGDLNEL